MEKHHLFIKEAILINLTSVLVQGADGVGGR